MQFDILRTRLKTDLTAANPLLPADGEWKRAHYFLAEKIINEKLKTSPAMTDTLRHEIGTTISAMTLRRFFLRAYEDETVNDLRFLKSIDKLCIALGYRNFTDFIAQSGIRQTVRDAVDNSRDEAFDFIKFIKDFLRADFESYNLSMDRVREKMEPFVIENSPYMARILEVRNTFIVKNMELVNENNRSNYELITAHVLKKDEHECSIETEEYWNLVYFSRNTGERFTYNHRNRQIYFLKNINGRWRIWENHNPNTGQFLKQFDYNPIS